MKTIYEEVIERAENGEMVRCNFKSKTLKIGRECLIKNGEVENGKCINFSGDFLKEVERLYANYYVSMPSEKSTRCKSYFSALSADEMSMEELIYGEERVIAKAKLEAFVLCCIVQKLAQWDDSMGSWFWKSEKFPSLVLLKEWFI